MSRTKRSYPTEMCDCRKLMISKYFTNCRWWAAWDWMDEVGLDDRDCHIWDIYRKRIGRDGKPGFKPTKLFKQIKRRSERAKVRSAMKQGKWDNLPVFHNSDVWDWN